MYHPHFDEDNRIASPSLLRRLLFPLQSQICRTLCLIVGVFLLISFLSGFQLIRNKEKASKSGYGCDFNISPPHSSNRTVATTLCESHHALNVANLALLPESLNSIRFLVVGDFGRDGYCCQLDVAYEMSRSAFAFKPQFIVNAGDAFYEYGLLSSKEEQVKTSFEHVYLKYDNLRLPWFSVLGNHEYRGSPEAVLQMASKHNGNLFTMRARFWDEVIQMDDVQIHLFFIDTSPMMKMYYKSNYDDGEKNTMLHQPDGILSQHFEEQLLWFEHALNASASVKEVKIVVGHHPPYTSGSHYKEDENFLRETFGPLFERFQVRAYFSGHDHNLQEYSNKGTWYFVSGAGSKVEGGYTVADEHLRYFSQQNGFLAVEVTPTHKIRVLFLDIKGEVLRTTEIANTVE